MSPAIDSPELRGRLLLITGATGFIGSHLARAALQHGLKVRALVRGPDASAIPAAAEPWRGDLLQPNSLVGIESGVDYVVHCAGVLGKWGGPEAMLYELNVAGGVRLLERFRGGGVRRFLHLSAGGVTGPLPVEAADERYPCRPRSAYEKSKLAGEQEILARATEWALPVAVLRPTFTYGPGDPHKLPLFRAVSAGRFVFIGDGRSVLHPVFIDDLVAGILLALERARDRDVYILGGERPVTKRELIEAIADALGCRRPRLRIPTWLARPAAAALEALGRGLGFEPILTRSRVSMMSENFGYTIQRAREQLGYAPQTSLQQGIRRTADAYRQAGWLS